MSTRIFKTLARDLSQNIPCSELIAVLQISNKKQLQTQPNHYKGLISIVPLFSVGHNDTIL